MGNGDKECEGCTSHSGSYLYDKRNPCDVENFDFGCDFPIKIGTNLCPCSICIIKVTCKSGCDEFFNYMSIVRKERS